MEMVDLGMTSSGTQTLQWTLMRETCGTASDHCTMRWIPCPRPTLSKIDEHIF